MDAGKAEAQQHVFLNRASRASRGKRMTKLLDDEVEEDELFWNQDALKEDEVDEEYAEEGEVADVFDSDFDEDEPEADDEGENEPEERTRTKKKLTYPGNPSSKKKKKKKDNTPSKVETAPNDENNPEESTPSEHHDAPDEAEVEKSVRKSTRTSVIIRQAERDAIRAALQATMKPIKRKSVGEEKKITQEEMLLEAAQTEIMNVRNLEKVLAREEEVKKRAIVHKAVYSGPQIRFLSKNGLSYLTFMNGSSFDSGVSTKSTPYSEKAVCAVTGVPAIYRDPKTGLPYATKEAFKIIRERFAQESSCKKKDSSMGILSDATYEPGFTQKRKRSVIPQDNETSYFRQFARFRRIPAVEIEDSD